MTKIIKLTLKDRCTIKAGSSPDVKVNEEVTIPPYHYGELYIRKSLGSKALNVPRAAFHEEWTGVPEICLIHSGATDVEFLAGEEIGELHIRYSPPAPDGKFYINSPFATRYIDGNTHVATPEGSIYAVDDLYIYLNDEYRSLTSLVPKGHEGWVVHQIGVFTPKSYVTGKMFLSLIPTETQKELLHTAMNLQLNVGAQLLDTPDNGLAESLQKILEQAAKQSKLNNDILGNIKTNPETIDFGKHTHVGVSDKSEVTITLEEGELVQKLKLGSVFKYTNDGEFITAWLGGTPFAKVSKWTRHFEGTENGFVYDAKELPDVSSLPESSSLLEDNDLVLINPVLVNKDLIYPSLEEVKEFGQIGGLVFRNSHVIKNNLRKLPVKHSNFMAFYFKALLKCDSEVFDMSEVRSYLGSLRTLIQTNSGRLYIDILKSSDNAWTRPLRVIDLLSQHFPSTLEEVLSGKQGD